MCVCVCVCVCLCVRGMQIAPKQIKGLVVASLLTPPLGVVVCEGVTLGAVGGGGALVCSVWFLGLGCVGVWFLGPWVKKPR